METTQKTAVKDSSQQKVEELQSELNALESKVKNKQYLSEEDVKFVGELGWLSAAAVLVASIATNV